MRALVILALALALTACGEKSRQSSGEDDAAAIAARAAELRPTDSALAATYDRSCRSCHANPSSGAPLTGDGAAWAPRLAQGNRTLLDHVVQGYKGMPPLGMCPGCSVEEFRALITFMATDASGEEGK